jgi:tetratricopeptide (TPR) repeat protein
MRVSRVVRLSFIFGLGLISIGVAQASDDLSADADVQQLRTKWAHIKYQVKDPNEQLKDIDTLAKQAAEVVKRYPDKVEPLLWQGIITSEEAAMAGVFDQLHYVTEARGIFEKAEALTPGKVNPAVEMSLGVIYYRVPGFPIAFGDDGKARQYLETALSMDPNGLDANYFYGDFLIEQGEYQKAKVVLTHAMAAPADPNRPVWDAGRRADVQALIAKIDKRFARTTP